MKRLILSIALIITASATSVFATDPINISFSNHKADERDVRNFNSLASGGPIQVIVTLGSTEGLRFEGDADAISTLVTEVKGTALIIRPQTSWTSWAHKYQGKKIVAYVSAKSLKSLTQSGDGSITVNGKISGSSLTATLSGSGFITASAEVSSLTTTISGSGKVNLTGQAKDAVITLSGSGSFTKSSFAVDHLSAVISGSGSVNITANDAIDATISGSGSVNYRGNASVSKRVFGSGRVRKV